MRALASNLACGMRDRNETRTGVMGNALTRKELLASAAGAAAGMATGSYGRITPARVHGDPALERSLVTPCLCAGKSDRSNPHQKPWRRESRQQSGAHSLAAPRHSRAAAHGKMTWCISWLRGRTERQQYKDCPPPSGGLSRTSTATRSLFPAATLAPMFDTREHKPRNHSPSLAMTRDGGERVSPPVAWWLDSWMRRTSAF